tara:strand:+ start:526 stop:972 length:447 start_codon:yes stop_codon:yes gene_type:complete
MKATDYKLENDGTLKMYAGNGGLIATYDNVDSMFQAEELMNEYNTNEIVVHGMKEAIDYAVVKFSENRNFDIVNFMYFANNFHHDWMKSVWDKDTNMHKHLSDKWRNLCSRNEHGGTANFLTFFMDLDDRNKNVLCDWISKNYSYRLD